MLSIKDCPENWPKMPDHATCDGVPVHGIGSSIVGYAEANPEIENKSIGRLLDKKLKEIRDLKSVCPTLVAIGLKDALVEVEAVLAWNQTEKHPDSKWKTKTAAWHNAKALKHLSQSQCGVLQDEETKRSHMAHAAARLLMSLAHELRNEST